MSGAPTAVDLEVNNNEPLQNAPATQNCPERQEQRTKRLRR